MVVKTENEQIILEDMSEREMFVLTTACVSIRRGNNQLAHKAIKNMTWTKRAELDLDATICILGGLEDYADELKGILFLWGRELDFNYIIELGKTSTNMWTQIKEAAKEIWPEYFIRG